MMDVQLFLLCYPFAAHMPSLFTARQQGRMI